MQRECHYPGRIPAVSRSEYRHKNLCWWALAWLAVVAVIAAFYLAYEHDPSCLIVAAAPLALFVAANLFGPTAYEETVERARRELDRTPCCGDWDLSAIRWDYDAQVVSCSICGRKYTPE